MCDVSENQRTPRRRIDSLNWPDASIGYEKGQMLVFTRDRLMYFRSRTAWLRILYCRLFHSPKMKSWSMPSAGKYLWFPVNCFECGCRYEVVRHHGWWSPWRQLDPKLRGENLDKAAAAWGLTRNKWWIFKETDWNLTRRMTSAIVRGGRPKEIVGA